MKNFLKFSTISIISFCLLWACQSDKNNTLNKIKKESKIRVGYISYFDITYKDLQTGEMKGFLVDVMKEVAKRMAIKPENVTYIETDWQNFGLGLESGKYDLSISGTFNTEPRRKIVDFSDTLFYLGNGAIVKATENRFSKIEDFNKEGLTIAVVQGEQGYEYAKKNLTKAKLKALSGSDLSLAPLEVEKGLADVALSDQYILKRFADKHPVVKDALANNPYGVLPICWSVSKNEKDASLLGEVNKHLKAMKKDGTLLKMMDEYRDRIPFANLK